MLDLSGRERIILALLTASLIFGAALSCHRSAGIKSNIRVISPRAAPQAVMININDATAEELSVIPDLSPRIAASIVEYRDARGRFRNVEEIKEVKGKIGRASCRERV